MARYEITENIDIKVNVYNLTDETYIERIGVGHFDLGNDRSAPATVGFRF